MMSTSASVPFVIPGTSGVARVVPSSSGSVIALSCDWSRYGRARTRYSVAASGPAVPASVLPRQGCRQWGAWGGFSPPTF